MAAPTKNQNPQKQSSENNDAQMPFGKMNYILFIAGLLVFLLGFFLMAGEKFIDSKQFSKALYVAPPVIIAGLALIAYGIMVNPGKRKDDAGNGAS